MELLSPALWWRTGRTEVVGIGVDVGRKLREGAAIVVTLKVSDVLILRIGW